MTQPKPTSAAQQLADLIAGLGDVRPSIAELQRGYHLIVHIETKLTQPDAVVRLLTTALPRLKLGLKLTPAHTTEIPLPLSIIYGIDGNTEHFGRSSTKRPGSSSLVGSDTKRPRLERTSTAHDGVEGLDQHASPTLQNDRSHSLGHPPPGSHMNLSTPQNATHLHIHGTGNTVNINSGSGQQCVEVKEAPEVAKSDDVPQQDREEPQAPEHSRNTDRSLPTYELERQQEDSSVASSESDDGYYLRDDCTYEKSSSDYDL